ncbi:MAG: hypothetical protein D6706_03100 [Chloroflexi bacterium]|nr:MAG: hypothetical protein D6706_03100 [Chloroflexota bacterium]
MTTRRLFALLLLLALFAMGVRETLDPDMWWHLRTGEYILQHGIPRQDVFSFTVPEHEWVTHEWLSQLFMWLVYRVGGFAGLIVVFAGFVVATFGLVYRASEGRPYLAGFVTLLAAITSAIVWGARPQMFNLLLTAVFVLIVQKYRNRQGAFLWLLPPLTALWANLHSGYLLGVVFLAAVAFGETWQRWQYAQDTLSLSRSAVRRLWLVTGLSFLAAALNPNGPTLWVYPFFTLGSNAMQVYIQEWHSPDFHLPMFWPFAGMMAVGVMALLFSAKRPSWTELLLFLGTAGAGLLSARHIPLFAIISAPIISRHLLASTQKSRIYPLLAGETAVSPPPPLMRFLNLFILLMAIAGVAGWTATKITGNEMAIAERYPVAAVDYLEQAGLADEPGYNTYNWGGYLVWRGIPVFVDGRADVYGDPFLFYYLQTYQVTENWDKPLDDFAVRYVLMERDTPLTAVLTVSNEWHLAYQDDVAVIFVRNDR